MPRTKGRAGETLDGTAIDGILAAGVLDVRWSIRLVDTGGNWASSTAWVFHEVPAGAVLLRSRSAALDGGPWRLTLALLADALPQGSLPKHYQRLEIDRVIGGSQWPYFTGIVDSVETDFALQQGAAVRTYKVEAFGVSQRTKGYWINSLSVSPEVLLARPFKALGVCREVRGSFSSSGPGGRPQDLPGATVTYDLANRVTLSADANYSNPLSYGTAYTIDASQSPAKVMWTSDASIPQAGAPVYYKYPRVEHFGIPRYLNRPQGQPAPQFFLCPYGRDPQDVFETEVKEYTGGGSPTITPKDPTPYNSDATIAGLLDPWKASGSSLTASLDASQTAASVTAGTDFRKGDFIRIDNEVMYVSGIASNTLTVTRGFDGSTAASHANGTAVKRGQYEYLSVTPASTGTDSFVEIASTSTSGVITLASAPSPTPAAGDAIRAVTTELYSAWDEHGCRYSTGMNRASQIGFWRKTTATVYEAFSNSDTTLTVSDGSAFAVGDIILIWTVNAGTEQLLVDGKSGNDLTVRRGVNGTTAVSHDSSDAIYVEWDRSLFEPHPEAGTVKCAGKHFTPSDSVYITASPIKGPFDGQNSSTRNRAEEILKTILGTYYVTNIPGTGLYANDDIQIYANSDGAYGPTGAFVKNVARYQIDLADWVAEFKDGVLPPNCYIRDERDGKLSIRSYFMASIPSGRLAHAISIQERADPEPATAVVVVSEQDRDGPINMASVWLREAPTMDSAIRAAVDNETKTYSRVARDSGASMYNGGVFQAGDTILTVTDGSKFSNGQTVSIEAERMSITQISSNNLTLDRGADGTSAVAHDDGKPIGIVDPRGRGEVKFRIPGAKPYQVFPFVDEVRVYGSGYVTLAIEQGGTRYFVPEATYRSMVSKEGAPVWISISGEVLNRAAANLDTGQDWDIRLEVHPEKLGASSLADTAYLAEVEIWTRAIYAWRAELSDSLTADYQPGDPAAQFGSTFVATTPGKSGGAGTLSERLSRLWAPSDYLKRVVPKYDSNPALLKHRHKILHLPKISMHDCRWMAEEFLLEETYKATPFEVTAPLDDRIEIGDTVSLDLPDATSRLLFVEGIADGGGLDDHIATYTLTDRSVTNRQVV